jgi:uncharacterized protein
MDILVEILHGSWEMLLGASIYVLFGLLVGGLLKVFLTPGSVAKHLGKGGAGSVFKAALIGIPLPICSCGVLPIAASLKKQGASNGATTAFLVSTPESGVDSISITYALLDPLMTIARPVSAFFSAIVAGLSQNFFFPPAKNDRLQESGNGKADPFRTASPCLPVLPHLSVATKIRTGIGYATGELWHNIAIWFLVGILLSGIITVLAPETLLSKYGSGLSAKLIMLVIGIPLYTCASASTPIAAALIVKGISPGAALVYLLVGPATSMASLTVLTGLLGRKATLHYLAALAASALLCGILLDFLYDSLDISARAVAGQAAEIIPSSVQTTGAVLLLLLSISPVSRAVKSLMSGRSECAGPTPVPCGCAGGESGSAQPLHGFKGS